VFIKCANGLKEKELFQMAENAQLPKHMITMVDVLSREDISEGEAIHILRDIRRKLKDENVNFLDFVQPNSAKLQKSENQNIEIIPFINAVESSERSIFSWVEFLTEGTKRFGKGKGLQQVFLESNPQYNWGHIAKWRKQNEVPAAAMVALENLKIQIENNRGKDWSQEEKDYLVSIIRENPKIKNKEIAKILSEKFGRTITEGAAKGAKHREIK